MAAEMGSDDKLASQYVVFTSISSMATIFVTVLALRGIGLL
jgi:predicted permease